MSLGDLAPLGESEDARRSQSEGNGRSKDAAWYPWAVPSLLIPQEKRLERALGSLPRRATQAGLLCQNFLCLLPSSQLLGRPFRSAGLSRLHSPAARRVFYLSCVWQRVSPRSWKKRRSAGGARAGLTHLELVAPEKRSVGGAGETRFLLIEQSPGLLAHGDFFQMTFNPETS